MMNKPIDLREMMCIKIKVPPLFRTRLLIVTALIRLAALISWCDIQLEIEEKKDAH